MFRTVFIFPALATGLVAVAAQAAQSPTTWRNERPAASAPASGIQLAQYRDTEVYIDPNGNRVIVDTYTGEVIAVQPRRMNRAEQRRYLREQRRGERDRYYLDDPEDMARLRREKLREYGDPSYEDPDAFPEAPRPAWQDDERDYGGRDGDRDYDAFPETPRERRAIVREEPVQRMPLPSRAERAQSERPAAPQDQPGTEAATLDPQVETDPAATGTVSQPSIESIEASESPASGPPPLTFTAREDVAALQVLLDRAGASPGVIDGKFGSNVDKALVAYRMLTKTNLKSTDVALIKEALTANGGDAFTTYTISPEDAAGPYVASIPDDYGQKAQLERMAYTSVTEMLAERFHMDEAYLKSINPDANFNRPGTIIRVANTGKDVTGQKVARITADKKTKQVFAYDAYDKLVAAYPATIGSSDTPSPTGTHAVSRIAFDPNYTYNPKLNFKQGENDKVLTIPPGPNGPVGSIWIALDKPTYGIHGTPEPSKIGKSESHGCVRLTNWDAAELARMVSAGVTVEFLE